MARKKRKIKVAYVKLGRQKAWGLADTYIEIDPRINGKKHLEILTHEALHIIFPMMVEEEIERASILLTNTLWAEHYRRVDNCNNEPLQDGKK